MDLFTLSVSLVAVVIGLVLYFLILKIALEAVAMLRIGPGFLRAILGFVGGAIALPVLVGLLRFLLMTIGFVDPNLPITTGTALIFIGFGALTGWLWGVGVFNPYSHEHNGLEHLREMPSEPTGLTKIIRAALRGTPGFVRTLLPFLQPLLIALTICVVVVVIFMALGMIPSSVTRIQTNTDIAAATTPAGSIVLGDTFVINKTLFFAILAFLILGAMATFAIVLALVMNALSQQVDRAKKAPPEPPTTEPALFRLVTFYLNWLSDVLEGAKRSITR